MGGNRTLSGVCQSTAFQAGALPIGHHSVSRRFRRKVRDSNPRTTNRHALAERCLNHSANLPCMECIACAAFVAFIESDLPRPKLAMLNRSRRVAVPGCCEDYSQRPNAGLAGLEQQSLDRTEPSAAPQSGCAGNRSLIAGVFVSVAMTESSLLGEDTRCSEVVKTVSTFSEAGPRSRSRRVGPTTGVVDSPPWGSSTKRNSSWAARAWRT
jgi:hypothetical protein